MHRIKLSDLRKMEVATKQLSQGAKHIFFPIIVKAGQSVGGLDFDSDEVVETYSKSLKVDGPTLIAMQFLEDTFKETTELDESVIMRLGLCAYAASRGCDDKHVIEMAQWFQELLTGDR